MQPKFRKFLRHILLLVAIAFAVLVGFHIYRGEFSLLGIDVIIGLVVLLVYAMGTPAEKQMLNIDSKE